MAANLTASGPTGGVAFMVYPYAPQTNMAINTLVVVTMDTEVFDVGGNFASNAFTAPVTGKYQINASIRIGNLDTASAYDEIYVTTSNKAYYTILSPKLASDPAYWTMNWSGITDMDANDTAYCSYYQSGGSQQTDLHTSSYFSGFLVA